MLCARLEDDVERGVDILGGEKVESPTDEVGVPYPGLFPVANTGATEDIGLPREIGTVRLEEMIELSVCGRGATTPIP